MEPVVIELAVLTSERAQRLARARGTMIEALAQSPISQLDRGEAVPDALLGLCADEPARMAQLVAQAMQTRETQPLRPSDG